MPIAAVIVGVQSLVYTVISCLMMAGAPWFRPGFPMGNKPWKGGWTTLNQQDVYMISAGAVESTARLLVLLLVLALIHYEVQQWWTRNRPTGAAVVKRWGLFDVIASFAPAFFNLLVFLVTLLFQSKGPWWWWLQLVYGLIIYFSVRDDIYPTIKYWREHL